MDRTNLRSVWLNDASICGFGSSSPSKMEPARPRNGSCYSEGRYQAFTAVRLFLCRTVQCTSHGVSGSFLLIRRHRRALDPKRPWHELLCRERRLHLRRRTHVGFAGFRSHGIPAPRHLSRYRKYHSPSGRISVRSERAPHCLTWNISLRFWSKYRNCTFECLQYLPVLQTALGARRIL